MEVYLIDWLSLLGRWFHMIVGVAWIGASFYFIWLDNHLQPPASAEDTQRGVSGELWAVHGGGFYHAQKYAVAPPTLPPTLHWFKWEAYTTWLSGMFLLVLIYWVGADIYTIDPAVMVISQSAAVSIGIATLVFGWLGYDALCKSSLGKSDLGMAIILLIALSIIAYFLCQVFSGRAAYMHFGAMLGTIMVANVAHVIMPGQRALVAAKQADLQPDPAYAEKAKQRSVHNTYFTLPVLFVMISNHYAMTHAHKYNWLILIAVSLAGALIRVYFVARHKGAASPLPAVVATILLAATAFAIMPRMPKTATTSSAIDTVALFTDVQQIAKVRCVGCHARVPVQPGFAAAPNGVMFDTPEQLIARAPSIYQQSVATHAMPPGNLTGITDAERMKIGEWIIAGAPGPQAAQQP